MGDNEPRAAGPVGPELLERLFDRHAAALEFYARQWCANPEDVVQSAGSAGRRAAGAARRCSVALPRRADPGDQRFAIGQAAKTSRGGGRLAGEGVVCTPSPGRRDRCEGGRRALEGLPDDEREVVVARLWGGLTFQQIGAVDGHFRQHGPSAIRIRAGHIATETGDDMSEERLNEPLATFEAALASLRLRPSSLDRARVMYLAGQASVRGAEAVPGDRRRGRLALADGHGGFASFVAVTARRHTAGQPEASKSSSGWSTFPSTPPRGFERHTWFRCGARSRVGWIAVADGLSRTPAFGFDAGDRCLAHGPWNGIAGGRHAYAERRLPWIGLTWTLAIRSWTKSCRVRACPHAALFSRKSRARLAPVDRVRAEHAPNAPITKGKP